jgi:hypothetical protein
MNTIERAYRAFGRERFPLPSENQVTDLEHRLRIELPPDYRQFLLSYNGGTFSEPRIVPAEGDCPLDRLRSLRGIGATFPEAEIASPASLAIFRDNDPPQVLPIGYTLMGNLIYLITHPKDRGCIGLKKAFSQQWFHLASGIEEFFGLLQEPPPDE